MKPATVSKLPQIFQASECFENIGEFTIHYLFQSLLLVTYQMSQLFLGPRGPLVLPSVGPSRPSRPMCAKDLDHLYTGIYAL